VYSSFPISEPFFLPVHCPGSERWNCRSTPTWSGYAHYLARRCAFRHLAHRAFCAARIRARAASDRFRFWPLPLRAVMALLTFPSCAWRRARSSSSCCITALRCRMICLLSFVR
jgi:hypothetical protein